MSNVIIVVVLSVTIASFSQTDIFRFSVNPEPDNTASAVPPKLPKNSFATNISSLCEIKQLQHSVNRKLQKLYNVSFFTMRLSIEVATKNFRSRLSYFLFSYLVPFLSCFFLKVFSVLLSHPFSFLSLLFSSFLSLSLFSYLSPLLLIL